jgi:hypothetical protein
MGWNQTTRPVGDGAGPGPVLASPHDATSMPSYCKSCIEYLARLQSVIPPPGIHSSGYRHCDAALRVGPNCFRKQYTFRCARNEDSKAQRPKRSTRSSAECNCGSRETCGSSTHGVFAGTAHRVCSKLHTSLRKDGSCGAIAGPPASCDGRHSPRSLAVFTGDLRLIAPERPPCAVTIKVPATKRPSGHWVQEEAHE